jgi:hypothetical protein
MHSIFEHLMPLQKNPLTVFLGKIITTIQPDKIICYGYRITDKALTIYDLLVIPNSNDNRNDYEIVDIIATIPDPHITATCIICKPEAAHTSIAKGSWFFISLYFKAPLSEAAAPAWNPASKSEVPFPLRVAFVNTSEIDAFPPTAA